MNKSPEAKATEQQINDDWVIFLPEHGAESVLMGLLTQQQLDHLTNPPQFHPDDHPFTPMEHQPAVCDKCFWSEPGANCNCGVSSVAHIRYGLMGIYKTRKNNDRDIIARIIYIFSMLSRYDRNLGYPRHPDLN